MSQRAFSLIASAIFLLIALAHMLRLVLGGSFIVLGFSVPMWGSAFAVVVTGFLAYQGFGWQETARRAPESALSVSRIPPADAVARPLVPGHSSPARSAWSVDTDVPYPTGPVIRHLQPGPLTRPFVPDPFHIARQINAHMHVRVALILEGEIGEAYAERIHLQPGRKMLPQVTHQVPHGALLLHVKVIK